jgi:hypothetical protein
MKSQEELVKVLRVPKFKIKSLKLTIKDYGEYDVQPLYFGSMILEKDYDSYNFPFLEISIAIPNRIYRAIKKNPANVDVYLNIKYALFKMDEPSGTSKESTNPKEYPWLAKNFYVYGIDGSPVENITEQEKVEDFHQLQNDDGDINNLTTTALLLYDKEILQKVNVITNEVITRCTLSDAITRTLNAANISGVLMSPSTSANSYKELTLLPQRTDEQLEHLCNDYSMYKEGGRIFFDFDCTYILRKSPKCTAWRPGEYKKTYVVYFPADEMPYSKRQGIYKDSSEKANYCTMYGWAVTSPGTQIEQNYGTSYQVLDSKTGKVTTYTSSTELIDGKETAPPSRMLVTNFGDTDTANEMVSGIEKETTTWRVMLDSVVPDFIDPNKEINLVFYQNKLSKYNGVYYLKKFFTNFERSDTEWFTTNTELILTKRK